MFNLGLLIKTLSIQSESNNDSNMIKFVKNFLSKNRIKYKEDTYGNIYVTKGQSKSYACIVSHMDTVHPIIDKEYFKVFKLKDILYTMNTELGEQIGIGGDDKVGVYITLQLLKDLDNIKAVFYRNEEIGCLGSKYSIQHEKSFYNNCNFILQCDRKYKNNFITESGGIKMCSTDFIDSVTPYMEKYGFKEERGISTDVDKLVKGDVGISCANISSGYYRPHTNTEIVKISEVLNTFNFVTDVINNLGGVKFEYEYIPASTYDNFKSSFTYPVNNKIYFDKIIPKYIYQNIKPSKYPEFNIINNSKNAIENFYEYSLKDEEQLIPVKDVNCNICKGENTIVYYPKDDIFMCKKCGKILSDDTNLKNNKQINNLYRKLKITSKGEDFVFNNLEICWIKKDDSKWSYALNSYATLDEDRYKLAY